MPSAEMRRSTRVFVPKAKDGELVRVLRSGRRLWVESGEVKHRGGKDGDDWFPLIDNYSPCKEQGRQQQDGWHEVGPEVVPMEVDEGNPTPELVNRVSSYANESSNGEKMFKNVYSRKRKRLNAKRSQLSIDFYGEKDKGEKKFGLHFVRRQRRKLQDFEHQRDGDDGLLFVVIEPSSTASCLFSRFLGCLLGHMRRSEVGMRELSSFLLSTPISPVFASFGIHFLRGGLSCTIRRGFCRIFGAMELIPLFTMDFNAAPLCFQHLHATMYIRSVRLSCLCYLDYHWKIDRTTDIDEPLPVINDQSGQSLSRVVASIEDDLNVMKHMKPSSGSKLGSRNVHSRSGVTTRSGSKRRRRSLRTRRARNPSPVVLQKASGPPVSRHLALKKNRSSLPVALNQELRRSARKSSANVASVPKSSSSTLSLNVDVDSQCCYANILVVEADRCYRVERAEIMLDVSDSNEWVIAVKKDGLKRYCLKIQREMRPCITNRFTHALIWAAESGWKLEFPERKDWLAFKELYKICGERSVVPTTPVVKIIPVPGVCEVTNACDTLGAIFKRPNSYLRMTSDELSRAFSCRTANYDMDSEDEEWLGKLNSELDTAAIVTEESFELMIDALEKASYCSPQGCNDETTAANLCMNFASSAVAEVYGYWMNKRKQRGGPLNRLFQYNQPTRAQLITKPVLRKKRSLKRQTTLPNQRGRGKDSSVLQAIAAERSAVDEQNAVLKVEEAKASANKSVELAILKRQRAQLLMENADLAMYRATMALRIADAAQIADSQQVAAHFLD